ncbi:hypothetical protein GBF38_000908, partial [Nibea albiflora]
HSGPLAEEEEEEVFKGSENADMEGSAVPQPELDSRQVNRLISIYGHNGRGEEGLLTEEAKKRGKNPGQE